MTGNADLWAAVVKIGGKTGYYGADLLWKIRGIVDTLAGGVGLSRGRRSKQELRMGDALDFWRVIEVESGSRLLLLAEMKTPGEALLDIKINELDTGQSKIVLLASFLPKGLMGLLYWYTLYPFHQYVFTQMLKGMVRASGTKLITPPSRVVPEPATVCRLPED